MTVQKNRYLKFLDSLIMLEGVLCDPRIVTHQVKEVMEAWHYIKESFDIHCEDKLLFGEYLEEDSEIEVVKSTTNVALTRAQG